MARPDPQSCFDDQQPRIRRWHLRLLLDFERQVLGGEATLLFAEATSGLLDLDTRGLAIHRVWASATDVAVPFELGPEDPGLGQRLRLTVPEATQGITIAYETGARLRDARTGDPGYLSGPGRALVPCQDSALAPISYDAEVAVPGEFSAVMAAEPAGDGPGPLPGTRAFRFRRSQPIAPGLLTLAVTGYPRGCCR